MELAIEERISLQLTKSVVVKVDDGRAEKHAVAAIRHSAMAGDEGAKVL